MLSNEEIIASGKIVAESLRKSRIRAITRYRATHKLIRNHRYEFNQIILDEREKLQNMSYSQPSEDILTYLGKKRLYRNARTRELRKLREVRLP